MSRLQAEWHDVSDMFQQMAATSTALRISGMLSNCVEDRQSYLWMRATEGSWKLLSSGACRSLTLQLSPNSFRSLTTVPSGFMYSFLVMPS